MIMAYSKAVNKATKKWVKANYDKISFTAPKGFNDKLTEASEKAGYKSKRQFIIATLTDAINKEEGK